MKLGLTDIQYNSLLTVLQEQGETPAAEPEKGTSDKQSGGQGYPAVGKWESGITRGPANQVGITKWADEFPIHFIVAGLDGTSDRQPFGDLLRLIPHAEDVERFTSLCSICRDGTIAIYSKYIGNQNKDSENKIIIGGTNLYQPVCRKHYLS